LALVGASVYSCGADAAWASLDLVRKSGVAFELRTTRLCWPRPSCWPWPGNSQGSLARL